MLAVSGYLIFCHFTFFLSEIHDNMVVEGESLHLRFAYEYMTHILDLRYGLAISW